MAKVYISSTFEDLKPHREVTYHALRQMEHDVIAMEDYTAANARPLDQCLADVEKCDVYIGIFAWRYGYIPDKDNPEKQSITELEYRRAQSAKKPRLIFLLNQKVSWPPYLMDAVTGDAEAGRRIQAFRQELGKDNLSGFFDTPESLAAQVSVAIHKVQLDQMNTNMEQYRRQLAAESDRRARREGQRVVGQHILDVSGHFKGRSKEVQRLGQLLAEPSTRVVSVIGRAGIGKTALASKILGDLERNRWPHTEKEIPVDGIAYLSTRTTGISLQRLFADCSSMLGGESEEILTRVWANSQLDTATKVERLLSALNKGTYVILLDHLEDLIDNDRHIADAELAVFFERSFATPNNARILLTSRYPLDWSPEMLRYDQTVPLQDGLSVDDGVALLREMDPSGHLGLRDLPAEQLGRAVERVHGIPRALQLFAVIVRDEWQKNLDQILDGFFENADVAQQLVYEAYARLSEGERYVMEGLAVLGRPVPQIAVEFMMAPFAPGLSVPGVLRRLIASYMVIADRTRKTLSLSPIDHDYVYSQLADQGPRSRQALERRAAEYWAQLQMPREHWHTALDIEPQFLEFAHRVKAEDYAMAVKSLHGLDVEFLAWQGLARKVQDMYRQLSGKLTDKRSQMLYAFGLGQTGVYVGPFEDAMEWMQDARSLARELGERDIERQAIGAMGEVKRRLGLLDSAVQDLEAAAAMYQPGDPGSPDGYQLALSLTYSYLGRVKEALDTGYKIMKLAETMKKSSDLQGRAHDALSLAFLVQGNYEQAKEYAQRGIKIYEEAGARDPLGYTLNVQGIALCAQDHVSEGLECFKRAQASGHECDNPRLESISLCNMARVYRSMGHLDQALAAAESATMLFKRVGAAELPAASNLAEAIRASTAGDKPREARALIDCARSSIPTPDLQPPFDLLRDAELLARSEGLADLISEAAALSDALKSRAGEG